MTEHLIPPPPAYPPAISAREPRPSGAQGAWPLPWWQQKPDALPGPEAVVDIDGLPKSPPPAGIDGAEEGATPLEDEALPEPVPVWFIPAPGYYPALPTPGPPTALSPRTRAALYNLTAAGTGYGLGLAPLISHAITAVGHTSISGALTLGCGTCLATAHFWDRRTRHWWPGLAWVARIPLASAVLALALYAPATTT
ncbi:hypothetical protein [Streptomyces aureoversilis]|uniref:Integral membrane protein n=1 Tax=Streptomyces aureoversilis TaxID=67277 RepID=A0ABV9ZS78_9ACTN